jgi:hypothetical protein
LAAGAYRAWRILCENRGALRPTMLHRVLTYFRDNSGLANY